MLYLLAAVSVLAWFVPGEGMHPAVMQRRRYLKAGYLAALQALLCTAIVVFCPTLSTALAMVAVPVFGLMAMVLATFALIHLAVGLFFLITQPFARPTVDQQREDSEGYRPHP